MRCSIAYFDRSSLCQRHFARDVDVIFVAALHHPCNAPRSLIVCGRSERDALEAPMRIKVLGLTGIVAMTAAIPALGHHSFAMFDAGKLVTLEGTVDQFQWTNPHAWIMLLVHDAEGKPVRWAIEMN